MGNNPSVFKGKTLPVESVTWKDCHEFIKKLNLVTGRVFRLPTEAEWNMWLVAEIKEKVINIVEVIFCLMWHGGVQIVDNHIL